MDRKKAIQVLSDNDHGGYVSGLHQGEFPAFDDSDVIEGEKTIYLDGTFCGAELKALIELMEMEKSK